jgi:hypothetical protein
MGYLEKRYRTGVSCVSIRLEDVMGTFLKRPQQRAKKREPKKQPPPPPQPPPVPDSGVAEAIDHFASIFSTWVTQERAGDNGSSLYSAPTGYPVRVRLLTDDDCDVFDGIVGTLDEQGGKQAAALERIATAFERIAEALTGQKTAPVKQEEEGQKC